MGSYFLWILCIKFYKCHDKPAVKPATDSIRRRHCKRKPGSTDRRAHHVDTAPQTRDEVDATPSQRNLIIDTYKETEAWNSNDKWTEQLSNQRNVTGAAANRLRTKSTDKPKTKACRYVHYHAARCSQRQQKRQ